MKPQKTNGMRILENHKIEYRPIYYDLGEVEFSGMAVSKATGIPAGQCYKTLTAKGQKKGFLVFVIPVDAELDLKKAALAAEDKNVEMLHQKDLLSVTGYQRGEVSPLGMKKDYPVYLDETMILYDEVAISAGKKGVSVLVDPEKLSTLFGTMFADLTR